ncbi:aminoglycoside adenylyltransferase domain-containing protein [Paenibacillus sp. S-38]|uniref:nucleotidyltransferase domain-containing protein n=1 Tax=Paenibacillus sp. S-38 TaxID=3416710 RepID=UPI003CF1F061
METKIPAALLPLLQAYADLLEEKLPGRMKGVYLLGSAALGAFRPLCSDVDVLGVSDGPLDPEWITELTFIHAKLAGEHEFGRRMEVQYAPEHKLNGVGSGSRLNLAAGACFEWEGERFKGIRETGPNTAALWILKHHGIRIAGAPAAALAVRFDGESLRREMSYNLDVYWAWRRKEPDLFLQDLWIEFAVLTFCRIFYTLDTGAILSKEGAAAYVRQRMTAWGQPVIDEALRIRSGGRQPLFRDAEQRRRETLRFLDELSSSLPRLHGLEPWAQS